MPYLAGPNKALCAPMPAKTISGRRLPLGEMNKATVPAAINPTSTPFNTTMIVRLLIRECTGYQGHQHQG